MSQLLVCSSVNPSLLCRTCATFHDQPHQHLVCNQYSYLSCSLGATPGQICWCTCVVTCRESQHSVDCLFLNPACFWPDRPETVTLTTSLPDPLLLPKKIKHAFILSHVLLVGPTPNSDTQTTGHHSFLLLSALAEQRFSRHRGWHINLLVKHSW